MRTIDISSEAILTAADVIPEDVPIFMLNLLRYKEHADYGERADTAPCSGREAYYQRYVPAFNKVAATNNVDGYQNFLARQCACPSGRAVR